MPDDVKQWLGGAPPLALEPKSRTLPQRWLRQMRALVATLVSVVRLALGAAP